MSRTPADYDEAKTAITHSIRTHILSKIGSLTLSLVMIADTSSSHGGPDGTGMLRHLIGTLRLR